MKDGQRNPVPDRAPWQASPQPARRGRSPLLAPFDVGQLLFEADDRGLDLHIRYEYTMDGGPRTLHVTFSQHGYRYENRGQDADLDIPFKVHLQGEGTQVLAMALDMMKHFDKTPLPWEDQTR